MIFILGKVAQGQVFLLGIWFSPVSIIPPVFLTHLYLHIALTRRTNGQIWEFPKAELFQKSGSVGQEKYFHFFFCLERVNGQCEVRKYACKSVTKCRGPTDMRCDTVSVELCNRSIYSRNTQCIVDLEHNCMYHILRTASHTKKLQCRHGIP